MAREQIERLELAFDGLSEDHRKVITLARIVGLPHKDIAAEMGRSESATRMLLFRALGQLGIALRSRSTT
jgi:RNA polymerase sigma factor (sigma-70 family)